MTAAAPIARLDGVRAVLFDLDGTLVDSLDDLHASVAHAMRRFGRPPLDRDTARGYIGDGIRVLLARAFLGKEAAPPPAHGDDDPERREAERQAAIADLLARARGITAPTLEEALAAFREHYRDHFVDRTRPYPGVPEALDALAARGYALGVVSNKAERFTRSILESLRLADRFTAIVGGDTVPEQKPHPAPVLHALGVLGAAGGEALFVGDSLNDYLSGRRASCRTALVLYGLGDAAVLRGLRPDLFLERFADLPAALGRTGGAAPLSPNGRSDA